MKGFVKTIYLQILISGLDYATTQHLCIMEHCAMDNTMKHNLAEFIMLVQLVGGKQLIDQTLSVLKIT